MGLDDLSFFNGMIGASLRIEPLPDPVYYYRIGSTTIKHRNRSPEAARFRAVAPYLKDLPDEERAYAAYAAACTANPGRTRRAPGGLAPEQDLEPDLAVARQVDALGVIVAATHHGAASRVIS